MNPIKTEQDTNEMTLVLKSDSKNEALARVAVSAFISQLDPLITHINDIKTAVSEAVTNAIIHGYNMEPHGNVTICCKYEGSRVYIEVIDEGVGIRDIEEAREPLFTSKPEMDRSGLGFTVMESFMDKVDIFSGLGQGTVVRMTKKLSQEGAQ